MADKPDPFDVEALGSAISDSAGRVSAIWVSFLIFALYLLTAAATVTDQQLFLAETIKLPVLNIELPLWGFFFLAPILFFILHIYVLLQVMLLARTAAAYNAAVDKLSFPAAEEASLRQRLANTLFAQIFAGSPDERGGWLGWLLNAMAWITLVLAPILILVVFQFAFLPYHSQIATWTHRLLILAELIVAFALWPRVLDVRRDFVWDRFRLSFKQAMAMPWHMLGPKEQRHDAAIWLWQRRAPIAAGILYVFICLSVGTFPGEPLVALVSGQPWNSVECHRWLLDQFTIRNIQFDLRLDRIVVPHIDAIDHQKLEQIEAETERDGDPPYQGERIRSVRDRDLNCGDFSDYADLRRIDWSGAHLRGSNFTYAILEGATLARADLQGADLEFAKLQGASFVRAMLHHADFEFAKLQGADLDSDDLQGLDLEYTDLQGANLNFANLQGADLELASLQGVSAVGTHFQGAFLMGAQFQGAYLGDTEFEGAFLWHAELQGAELRDAEIEGAYLDSAQLQGADLAGAELTHSIMSNVWTWRAKNPGCTVARVTSNKPDTAVEAVWLPGIGERVKFAPTSDAIEKFIGQSTAEIPNSISKDEATGRTQRGSKDQAVDRMRGGLVIVDPTHDDTPAIAKQWTDCESSPTSTMPPEKFDQEHAALLRNLVCDTKAEDSPAAFAAGIVRNWIVYPQSMTPPLVARSYSASAQLAHGLLGEDGKPCAAMKYFDSSNLINVNS